MEKNLQKAKAQKFKQNTGGSKKDFDNTKAQTEGPTFSDLWTSGLPGKIDTNWENFPADWAATPFPDVASQL